MSPDEKNERIALVADGSNISYEEAEKLVDKWIKEKQEALCQTTPKS
jgi:hypothetical protein